MNQSIFHVWWEEKWGLSRTILISSKGDDPSGASLLSTGPHFQKLPPPLNTAILEMKLPEHEPLQDTLIPDPNHSSMYFLGGTKELRVIQFSAYANKKTSASINYGKKNQIQRLPRKTLEKMTF